jgi:hypothetical protein
MDPSTKYVLIATVILAAIILVALLARHFNSHDSYTVLSPATPLLQDAMSKVLNDINLIGSYGRAFLGAKVAGAPSGMDDDAISKMGGGVPILNTARIPVSHLTHALEKSAARIKRTPPSWDNYAQIYRALGGSDLFMGKSAQSYIDAGQTTQQLIASNPGDPDVLYYTIAGDSLISMGRQIRALVADIHNLGVALDLE